MGSIVEVNDTLRITKEQGFPAELDLKVHLQNPYSLDLVKDKVFRFTAKPKIRVYQAPPNRNFLVEDVDGKWVCWGLCHILSVEHDYVNQETSGTFKITYLNSAEEMETAYNLIYRIEGYNYFQEKAA